MFSAQHVKTDRVIVQANTNVRCLAKIDDAKRKVEKGEGVFYKFHVIGLVSTLSSSFSSFLQKEILFLSLSQFYMEDDGFVDVTAGLNPEYLFFNLSGRTTSRKAGSYQRHSSKPNSKGFNKAQSRPLFSDFSTRSS